MKILHLSSEKTWRGGEQQIAYLVAYSLKHGVDIVVCARKDSAFEKWCGEQKVKCISLGFRNGLDMQTAMRIRAVAKKESVDAIHVHSGRSLSLAYFALLLGMKRSVIVHRRVDFPLKTGGPSLRKYNHPRVKAIICVSGVIASEVRRKVKQPDRVEVVYSGIAFERFTSLPPTGYLHSEYQIPKHKHLIANISALADHKDYFTFLQTAKELLDRRKDCHFLIVGDGELMQELLSETRRMGLENGVTFTGFRSDIPRLFRELSVFLITSKMEGLGTTVIDALYNGIPVVATRGGGIPELVRDGVDGLVCEVGDSSCLAGKVSELLDNPELRNKFKEAGIDRSRDFSKERMGEGILAIYRKVL